MERAVRIFRVDTISQIYQNYPKFAMEIKIMFKGGLTEHLDSTEP